MTIKRVIYLGSDVQRVPVRCWTEDIEGAAEQQLINCASMPFIHKHIAAMPDVHWGMGSTVGSVIPTKKALIPAAVGVDIGCGMMAHKTALRAEDLPDSLALLRSDLEAAIPHGRTDNGGLNDRGAWGEIPKEVSLQWSLLSNDVRFKTMQSAHAHLTRSHQKAWRHLGTLGTGNHFVELCLDKEGSVWVMLHSGSRGIGNAIGRYFIQKAKEEMERWHIKLPDPDLAYLPQDTLLFQQYWEALGWAQDFAAINRHLMMIAAKRVLAAHTDYRAEQIAELAVNCHHNYVALENHFGENVYVTRKGAVRARAGDLGIIPGSMGARSFIVRGKGNPDSFNSCSHGAGRKISRAAAKKAFGVADLVEQTAGVECRKDADVIDEIPAAYKDIGAVMANQDDLVEVVAELKQVLCVKG